MAQRTVAEFITPKQQVRLEAIFREELLAAPSTEGGPQRVVENEDTLRELLRMFLPRFAEPYFRFVSDEVEITTNYSVSFAFPPPSALFDKEEDKPPSLNLPALKQKPCLRRVRLIKENDNCPSDQTLVRVLRKAGWELADIWDLRAFIKTNPDIPGTPTGKTIYAPATTIPSESGKKHWPAVAHWDCVKKVWVPELTTSQFGPILVRRIEPRTSSAN